METRGATWPMALRDALGSDADAGSPEPMEMLETHHRATLWIPWTLILLGFWLAVAPFSFGYLNEALWVQPSGGRGVWFFDTATHDALRANLMTISDIVSGVLLVVLGWRALKPDRPASLWGHASSGAGSCSRRSCCGRRRPRVSSTTRSSGCW